MINNDKHGLGDNTGNVAFSDGRIRPAHVTRAPHPQKRQAPRCGLPERSNGDVSGLFEVWSLFKFHQPIRL